MIPFFQICVWKKELEYTKVIWKGVIGKSWSQFSEWPIPLLRYLTVNVFQVWIHIHIVGFTAVLVIWEMGPIHDK